MTIDIRTDGIHHLALRSSDLNRAQRFYLEILGFAPVLRDENIFLFRAGEAVIGVRGPETGTPEGDRFDPFRVGPDHVALACSEESELERVTDALTKAGVENTGIKHDETLDKGYVAFSDPDGIKWEFYME